MSDPKNNGSNEPKQKKVPKNLIQLFLLFFVALVVVAVAVMIATGTDKIDTTAKDAEKFQDQIKQTKPINESDAKKAFDEQESAAKRSAAEDDSNLNKPLPEDRSGKTGGINGAAIPPPPVKVVRSGSDANPVPDGSADEIFRPPVSANASRTKSAMMMPEIHEGYSTTPIIEKALVGEKKSVTPSPTLTDDEWNSPESTVTRTKKVRSRYVLQQGAVVDVVLMNEVNTQNPGKLQFRVVADVYDSLGYSNLLIPKGSVLHGSYGTVSQSGLDRVPIAINRLMFNDGRSVDLRDTEIVDGMGSTGATALFHSNLLTAIGPSALVSWLGYRIDQSLAADAAAQAAANGGNSNNNSSAPNISQQIFPKIENRIAERYGSAKPYYTIQPGARLNIIVSSDIVLTPENLQKTGVKK